MGAFSSKSNSSHSRSHPRSTNGPARETGLRRGNAGGSTFRFSSIADNFHSLDQVQDALRKEGVESCQLIVGVDFTKSNEWTGKYSFGARCLHSLGATPNPYEEAISAIGKTLSSFDDDNLIPCYGFGDVATQDKGVFSFNADDRPCQGLESVVWRYREILPYVKLSGPTSFGPVIQHAIKVVAEASNQYHILLIVADGQVTRSSDLPRGQFSPQETATMKAIVDASHYPLSIVMVGVGDGPWDQMVEFDDALPQREFDNFQFVNFTEVQRKYPNDNQRRETLFALRALMEIPEQYKAIQKLGYLGRTLRAPTLNRTYVPRPPPPVPTAQPNLAHFSEQGTHRQPGPANPPAGPRHASANGVRSTPDKKPKPAATPMPELAPGTEIDALFICPITQDIMSDPVIASDGFTYDRPAIVQWLTNKRTSPMTGAALASNQLIPNHALRSSIREFVDNHKAAAAAASSAAQAAPAASSAPRSSATTATKPPAESLI
jgi:E3 ubiquitin-protein ligase RGLG